MSGASLAHFTHIARYPGIFASVVNRVSGVLLALFLPAHFIVLGLTLAGAQPLQSFLDLVHTPLMEVLEACLIGTLTVHLACGLRILAIELLRFRDRSAATVSSCFAVAFFVGLLYLVNTPLIR